MKTINLPNKIDISCPDGWLVAGFVYHNDTKQIFIALEEIKE